MGTKEDARKPLPEVAAFQTFRRGRIWGFANSFEEALTVFTDPFARIHDDPEHSSAERREIIVGHSSHGRLILVSFTERTRTVRLISARRTTRHERKDYEGKGRR